MDQNIWKQIVSFFGSPLVAALGGYLIGFISQLVLSSREHKWKISDLKFDPTQKVMLDRIDLIEKLLTDVFYGATELIHAIEEMEHSLFDIQILNVKITFLQNRIQYLTAIGRVLKNGVIDDLLRQFEDNLVQYTRAAYSLYEERNDISRRVENFKNLGLSYGQMQRPFMVCIEELDNQRVKVLNRDDQME